MEDSRYKVEVTFEVSLTSVVRAVDDIEAEADLLERVKEALSGLSTESIDVDFWHKATDTEEA